MSLIDEIRKLLLRGRRRVARVVRSNERLDRTLGALLRKLEKTSGAVNLVHVPERVEVDGLVFHGAPGDPAITRSLILNGSYEFETTETIRRHLRAGSGFLDLGAHWGYFSLVASQQVGDSGKVIAVEPSSANRELLDRNVRANGFSKRVEIIHAAIGGEVGMAQLALSNVSSVSHRVQIESVAPVDVERVRLLTIDSLLEELGWPPIALAKMDIEGLEYEALAAVHECLARNPSMALIFEFHAANLRDAGVSSEHLFKRLEQLGFSSFWVLEGNGDIQLPEQLDQLDRLAQRRNVNILAERVSA